MHVILYCNRILKKL